MDDTNTFSFFLLDDQLEPEPSPTTTLKWRFPDQDREDRKEARQNKETKTRRTNSRATAIDNAIIFRTRQSCSKANDLPTFWWHFMPIPALCHEAGIQICPSRKLSNVRLVDVTDIFKGLLVWAKVLDEGTLLIRFGGSEGTEVRITVVLICRAGAGHVRMRVRTPDPQETAGDYFRLISLL